MNTTSNKSRKRKREMPEDWQILAKINEHPRDKRIGFEESSHKYTVDGHYEGWTSVTSLIHEFFPSFDPYAALRAIKKGKNYETSKYYGRSDRDILAEWNSSGKVASSAGTQMHLAIEQYFNDAHHLIADNVKTTKEWLHFMKFVKDHEDLTPYRLEWEVFATEYKLAGSIDAVFKRKDGSFVILDWKRSKDIKLENPFEKGYAPLDHIDNTNYWHYTLQLNIYKWFLETYYGLVISDLYIVIFHPDNKNYKKMRLNKMSDEIAEMLECRKNAVECGSKSNVILPTKE